MRVLMALLTLMGVVGAAGDDTAIDEPLDRAAIARRLADGKVYVGWRLLARDETDARFHVYRTGDNDKRVRVTDEPIRKSTDFVDTDAPTDQSLQYRVKSLPDGRRSQPASVGKESDPPYICLQLEGDDTFQKVGLADLDGDMRYDFVIKRPNANVDPWHKYWKPSSDTYKLEAYTSEGDRLWRYDLGWAIERGIWYSPYLTYDFDEDGRAEVAAKTGKGDPRNDEGKVESGPEFLTLFDGASGEVIAQTDWISRKPFYEVNDRWPYNYASRNQLGVAYLDGETPHLIVERGTYNLIIVEAYRYGGSTLQKVWRWDNREAPEKYWGQGAHWMHSGDVDGDQRDEVILGSAVLDDDGSELWSTGLGHPDHYYVGEIDPRREGYEIYYGIEARQQDRNGMCLVDAASGEILWGYEGFTRHVHSRGMCSNISSRHAGRECYSTDTDENKNPAWSRFWSAEGRVIGKETTWGFGPLTVWWDSDPQRELLWKKRIRNYKGDAYSLTVEGDVAAIADIVGDWREEIITSVPGELRVYTTTLPADSRSISPMRDPIYRTDVAHAAMGYFQVPMTGTWQPPK